MSIIQATVSLESTAAYSSSRQHCAEKLAKESHDAYDRRTWREKATYADGTDRVVIPRMSFKFALMSAAQYLGEKVPEKGMKTWTQYFTSAVMIQDDLALTLTRDQLQSITLPCAANGNRKSGKRVNRTFPIIQSWSGALRIDVLDPTITQEIFTRVVQHAGLYIGIGRFRPENGGFNGRFLLKKLAWKKLAEAA